MEGILTFIIHRVKRLEKHRLFNFFVWHIPTNIIVFSKIEKGEKKTLTKL